MRTLILAVCLGAAFVFAVPHFAVADEFDGDARITQHHWGRGYHRGGRRGGHRGGGYYYGGGSCW